MTSRDRGPGTWVTDMRHFLDASGAFPEGIPGPALNLALFLGAIVAWVTSGRARSEGRTNVACRWRSGRRPCRGEIVAAFEPAGAAIVWRCPACGASGVTRGWEGTRWDRRAP
jgi:hypothetical protein